MPLSKRDPLIEQRRNAGKLSRLLQRLRDLAEEGSKT